MLDWQEPRPVTVPSALEAEVGGHPLVARLLARRGMTDPSAARAFLNPKHYQPAPPSTLPDLRKAVRVLLEARTEGRRVCVWGDFDADGQTAAALLVEGLTQLGLDVFYHIPDRATEGHGLNIPGMRKVIHQGAGLILTCDCGTGDHGEILLAQGLGAQVIVTDHHEPPLTLPPAVAVVNPQRLPENHPLGYLCGVGVAYMLLRALFEAEGHPEQAKMCLDLVALGTIADVALLRGDNRYLVQRGLPQLLYKPRPGIEALLRTAGVAPPELLDTEFVAFTLAPRLNAVGRLAHARTAVELLLIQDEERALKLAADLEIYNDHRQRLCDEIEAEVDQKLHREPERLAESALVLASPHWHPGVIGIVASRLVERYGKPTILISTPPGEMGRASARSVPRLHIQKAIAQHRDLLLRSGGHAMAAGFTIHPSQIPAFREAFQATVAEMLAVQDGPEALVIDSYVSLDEVTPALVHELYRLAPFGPGNPAPLLACREVHLENVASLGATEAHTRLIVENRAGIRVPAVWWQTAPDHVPTGPVDVAFTLGLDTYADAPTARLTLVAVRPRQPAPTVVKEICPALPFAVEDMRAVPEREQRLRALLRERGEAVQVWAEGPAALEVPQARDRTSLAPGTDLVIWTIPPGPQELRAALIQVKPQRVYLLTGEISPGSLRDFLRELAHALRSVLSHQRGQTRVMELAAMTGHREATVRQGLEVLTAMGKLTCRETGGQLYVHAREDKPADKIPYDDLKRLLEETAAYRRYFTQANPEDLLQLPE